MKKLLKITFTLIFTTILLLGFAVPLNPVGNWYQQYLPNLPNFQVSDMLFQDSLTGFIVTGNGSPNDSSGYILKTTNAGNNWTLKFAEYRDFSRIKFVNTNTGYVSGGYFNGARIYKTTNAGENWQPINIPGGGQIYFDDMSVLNENILWVAASNSLVGGVFRTTNGGANWVQQYFTGSNHPVKIYMYNSDTGFIASGNYVRKTTNGGVNWSLVVSGEGFTDMHFVNSLTGYRSYSNTMKKTTDGGLNWVSQPMPQGGQIITSSLTKFSLINKDTIWGVGGQIFYGGSQTRGIIYRTINGGNNWQYQAPDTAYNLFIFEHIKFISNSNGWAYGGPRGVHTTTGGDPVWLTGIEQISTEIPKEYKLFQNYPNPFNPKTNIKYSIMSNVKGQMSNVSLTVYDITGREVIKLVDKEQNAGIYKVDFDGSKFFSGVYFYQLAVRSRKEVFTDTKRMVLVK